MKSVWLLAAALALAPLMATASGPGAVRKQVESSMLVTGELVVDQQGSVVALQIDQPDKLPVGVLDFVRKQVSSWSFEPVLRDRKAAPARSRMSLLVVGKRVEGDSFSIGIKSAAFRGPPPGEGERVSEASMQPPRYPGPAAKAGATGTAYLVLKVGRNGRVAEAVVEQVNLEVVASERDMATLRKLFADSSLAAARKWKFTLPTAGRAAEEDFWTVRVPIEYKMHGISQRDGYGIWNVYVPGPRATIPWAAEAQPGFSPDALAAGETYIAGAGPRLLTPLDGG